MSETIDAVHTSSIRREYDRLSQEIVTPQQLVSALMHPRLSEIVGLAVKRSSTELSFAEFTEVKSICDELGIPPNSYGWVVYTIYEDIKSQLGITKAVD